MSTPWPGRAIDNGTAVGMELGEPVGRPDGATLGDSTGALTGALDTDVTGAIVSPGTGTPGCRQVFMHAGGSVYPGADTAKVQLLGAAPNTTGSGNEIAEAPRTTARISHVISSAQSPPGTRAL